MYGWDGDTLALESSVHEGHYSDSRGNPTTKNKDFSDGSNFSRQDRDVADMFGQEKADYREYVGTPSGAFKGYDGKTRKTYNL